MAYAPTAEALTAATTPAITVKPVLPVPETAVPAKLHMTPTCIYRLLRLNRQQH